MTRDERDALVFRAKKLAKALAEVAEEVETGKLNPGRYVAFAFDGAPVCAFGHAVARAGFKAKEQYIVNVGVLWEYMNGGYGELPGLVRAQCEEAVKDISERNDLKYRSDLPAALRHLSLILNTGVE